MSHFSTKTFAAAVAGAALFAAAAMPAQAADMKGKEKCFGISKAGENGCAAANGSHSCAGQGKTAMSGQDWQLVEAGSCAKMGGKMAAFDAMKAMALAKMLGLKG